MPLSVLWVRATLLGWVDQMTTAQFMKGIDFKVMPQINLVLEGFDYMNDGGSFTLTTGVLS
jgi:hypothetical protein